MFIPLIFSMFCRGWDLYVIFIIQLFDILWISFLLLSAVCGVIIFLHSTLDNLQEHLEYEVLSNRYKYW